MVTALKLTRVYAGLGTPRPACTVVSAELHKAYNNLSSGHCLRADIQAPGRLMMRLRQWQSDLEIRHDLHMHTQVEKLYKFAEQCKVFDPKGRAAMPIIQVLSSDSDSYASDQ